MAHPKKIGFLSFGAWHPGGGLTHTGGDALASDGRARGRRRGDRDRRGVRPRPPLRPPALLAVPAARRDRRQDEPDRDRHRRDRHALREPALHGRDRRGRGPARRRPAPARRQPRLTRAGLARRRGVRLLGRPRRGTRQDSAVPRRDRRRRRRPRRQRRAAGRGHARRPAAVARPRRSDLVGLRLTRDRRLGGRAGAEPDELHAPARGHAGAVRPAPGRADRAVPRGVGEGRPRAGAARLGQPQRHPDHLRPRPAALRRRRERGPGRLARRRDQPLRPQLHAESPTGSPTSSPTTPPFRPPTRSS